MASQGTGNLGVGITALEKCTHHWELTVARDLEGLLRWVYVASQGKRVGRKKCTVRRKKIQDSKGGIVKNKIKNNHFLARNGALKKVKSNVQSTVSYCYLLAIIFHYPDCCKLWKQIGWFERHSILNQQKYHCNVPK